MVELRRDNVPAIEGPQLTSVRRGKASAHCWSAERLQVNNPVPLCAVVYRISQLDFEAHPNDLPANLQYIVEVSLKLAEPHNFCTNFGHDVPGKGEDLGRVIRLNNQGFVPKPKIISKIIWILAREPFLKPNISHNS